MDTKQDWLGPLLFIGIVGIAVYVVVSMNKPKTAAAATGDVYSYQPISGPTKRYDNEEIREITYNEDGLPTRIVIHRHAKAQ